MKLSNKWRSRLFPIVYIFEVIRNKGPVRNKPEQGRY